MPTALAICAGIAATAIVYQVMKARLKAAQADFNLSEAHRKETAALLLQSAKDLKDVKADRYQLAQTLKEAQEKLNTVKVTRDPKTGRMVSVKSK